MVTLDTMKQARKCGGGHKRTTTQQQDHYLEDQEVQSYKMQATSVHVSAPTVRNRLHEEV